MRSTIDIDESLFREALKLTGAKTKKDVVRLSLECLVRKKRLENLKSKLGNFPLDITLKDLKKMREDI
jgi:Arc/MetJ family transcription regulator